MPLAALVHAPRAYTHEPNRTGANEPLVRRTDWLARFNSTSVGSNKIVHLRSDTNELSRARLAAAVARAQAATHDEDRTPPYERAQAASGGGGGGVLLCRAQNSKGWQLEPCALTLAGKC